MDFSDVPADVFLRELATLRGELAERLHLPSVAQRIEIHLFADKATYRRYLAQRLPGVPYRRAMYVKQGQTGMVLACRGPDLEVDLRHEYTHALLNAALPPLPLWLDEGLAKYFEASRRMRGADSPYLAAVRRNVPRGAVQRLSALDRKASLSEMGEAEYRDSWAWVHFLLHGPPAARDELLGYLADLRAGNATLPLCRRIARNVPEVDARFAAHFRTWRPEMASVRINAPILPEAKIGGVARLAAFAGPK